ncbi:ORF311 [White spot syndrome virus]|uniref:ORF311 n=1 Tax=White spot syndrome virus TaxID=342409 RepID=A0A2D3I5F1_9VIRU|nr:ORF311 [White spot syndrome virus]
MSCVDTIPFHFHLASLERDLLLRNFRRAETFCHIILESTGKTTSLTSILSINISVESLNLITSLCISSFDGANRTRGTKSPVMRSVKIKLSSSTIFLEPMYISHLL